MKKLGGFLLCSCMLLLWTGSLPAAAAKNDPEIKGNLVIAGGALGISNTKVYEEFINLAGGNKEAKVGIIPAASGTLASSQSFKKDLERYGIPQKNIRILPLSNHDFSDTKENERLWDKNSESIEVANKIKKLTAVWFVGGDQLKISDTLRRSNGGNSKALQAVWELYRKGGVLGGTSAGAAVMSDVMISGGDSLGALKGKFISTDKSSDKKEYKPVYVTKGLGFFKYGILDQHFDERARLGRLAMTAIRYKSNNKVNFSYGIDEDTAMIVDNQKREIRIVGRGGLTVLDVSKAKKKSGEKTLVKNIRLSLLSPGDKVDLRNRTIRPNPDKDETKGFEYYQFNPLPATGALTPYGRLKSYLAYSLVDNSGAASVKSYLYDSRGKGFTLTFKKNKDTTGFWGYQDGQKDDYSVANVSLDISPSKLAFQKDGSLYTDYKKPATQLPDHEWDDSNKGNLVIVGGGLGSSNKEVYKKFINLADGPETGEIGIIPAASTSLKSSQAFKDDLIQYGVPSKKIDILPISNHDFKGTEEDESEWSENTNNKKLAQKIKRYTGFWFVGGDQTYITGSLLNKDGTKSKVLNSIWEVYKKGGVLGGTSAGAAIMSDVMIAGGGSLETLTQGFTEKYNGTEDQEGGPGYLKRGLGFFPYGIVDQHFDQKARLGRLIAVDHEKGKTGQYSYGIDEDTAMIVHNKDKTIEVAGRGGVSLVDLSRTQYSTNHPGWYKHILLSKITPGDSINLKTKKLSISGHKSLTTGNEYYNNQIAPHTGVLTPHGTWDKYLSYGLLDNSGEKEVTSYSFKENKGVKLTFRKTPETKGYWGYKDGAKDDYSFVRVALDIEPVRVRLK